MYVSVVQLDLTVLLHISFSLMENLHQKGNMGCKTNVVEYKNNIPLCSW